MKKLLTMQLLLCIFLFDAMSQLQVKGKITDEQNEPLPGVSVLVKNTSKVTITDINGMYAVAVMPTDSLVFSMVGMRLQTLAVSARTAIDVKMITDTKQIDEVVVIGYGTVRKSDLTGSVSSIKANDITKITALNAEQSLQGKVTGVQVSSTSGAPGAVAAVRVRGVGTFNNSSPIFVVDGVILDDISFLNAADIASMEVLKDASSTAMYGSRGSNGVILITTKTGVVGSNNATISYSGEYSVQQLAKKIDLLTGKEFASIFNEIKPGSYNNISVVPNTDWQDMVFKNAPVHSHQLSVSGATELTQYYVSLGYYKQDGIIEKSDYERITLKLNNTYQIAKHVKLGNNITVSDFKQQNAPNVTYQVYRAWPLLPAHYADGTFGSVVGVGNPLSDIENANDFNKGIRGVGNIFAEAQLSKSLTFKSSFGIDANYVKVVNFTPAFTVYNPDGTASMQQNLTSDLSKENNENMMWLWENTLSFNKTFGENTLDAVAGYTMQNTSSERLSIAGENILRNGKDFWYLKGDYVYNASTNTNKLNDLTNNVDPNMYYAMLSYLVRLNYTIHKRYILTGTFRRDGSSKFESRNRYSNFPSFAAAWIVTKESFMETMPALSTLKIRASWGIIGNDKINYADRYSMTQNLSSVFGIGDITYPAVTYAKSGNSDLKWESTTQTDIGIESGLFKNKLTAEFDYYHRVTKDILVELSTPGFLGNGQGQKIRYNAGSVLNSGFELNLNWRSNVGDVNYGIGLLGSTVRNEVLSVGGNSGADSVLYGGDIKGYITQSKKGLPIGAFYGYKTDGIFQNQTELDAYPHDSQAGIGDLRYVDTNNDGVINGKDRTFIGSPIPKIICAFNIELDYKRIDFSISIQGQTGNKIFNGKEIVRPDPYNFEKHVLQRWHGEGTSTTEPKPSFGGYNYNPSDKYIQDGSFLRLRSLTLGYTLAQQVSAKANIKTFRIFAKGTNLYTLTKFTGYTPEIGSGDVLSSGIDMGVYPITAVYSMGVNLTF